MTKLSSTLADTLHEWSVKTCDGHSGAGAARRTTAKVVVHPWAQHMWLQRDVAVLLQQSIYEQAETHTAQ
jgi:hypothetical protein